jgi:hypothetical protein
MKKFKNKMIGLKHSTNIRLKENKEVKNKETKQKLQNFFFPEIGKVIKAESFKQAQEIFNQKFKKNNPVK